MDKSAFSDHFKNFMLRLLPARLLSRGILRLTRIRNPAWKNRQIAWFIRHYGVDMQEALHSDAQSYPHFNAFFTRALKADARPLAQPAHAIVCPVDGYISQIGTLTHERMVQAKGRDFTLSALLGGQNEWVTHFLAGHFITLYLSPRDYHRVHMPLTGVLQYTAYVPGALFSVAPHAMRAIDGLLARNERLICLFSTAAGPMAVVLVGALFVAGMETVWAGAVEPHKRDAITVTDHRHLDITLKRGDELGRFNMGSTVVVLLQRGSAEWDSHLRPETPVSMGQCLGTVDMHALTAAPE